MRGDEVSSRLRPGVPRGALLALGLCLGVAWQTLHAESKGVFFEVDGGRAHLLGSVHVAKPELYPLAPAIQRAFAQADALALEARTGTEAMGEAAARMLQAARYPQGERLQDHLSPETRELLAEHAPKAGAMAGMLSQFKPWFVTVTLTMTSLQKLGYSPQYGVDRHFEDKADNKRIITLESIEEQLALFESMDAQMQDLMLRETLSEMDRIEELVDDTFRAWKAGDVDALEELILDMQDQAQYRPLYETLYLERNRNMARQIDALIEKGTQLFAVVGAGHLIGEGSVVELLRESGYSVRQIK